jgi:hypothetical protein
VARAIAEVPEVLVAPVPRRQFQKVNFTYLYGRVGIPRLVAQA